METPRPLPGTRRHHGARHLARGLCLGALILGLLGPAAAPAGAAAGPGVFFSLPGGALRSIPASELEARAPGLSEASYVVRATPGEAGEEIRRRGMPVGTALEKAEVHSSGYLTIPRPDGSSAYLPTSYFLDPSTFEGEKPAVFSVDGASTRFLRPLLANDPGDVNAEDNIATVSGEALVVGVHEGHVVEVQVAASTTATTAGSPVQFTASVVGGGEFNFAWTFGDGGTATGPSPSHPFAGSGTYLVRVTATGIADESGGESAPVAIVVGNPPTAEAPGAAATPAPQGAEPTGSPGKGRQGTGGKGSKSTPGGGHRSKSRGKSKSGGKSKGGSSAQRGTSPKTRSRSDESAETSAPPPSVPAEVPAPTPALEPTPFPAEPSSTAPEGEARTESPAPTAHAPSPPPSTSAGELVEGQLVGDDLGPATVEEALAGGSEGEGSRSAPGAVGKGGVGVPALALIVVALLAGGALFEWRRGRAVS